jgi:flagellar hook-length control protein FliK
VSAQGHPGQSSAQLTPIAVQQATLSTAAAPADAGSAMRPGAGLEHAIETVRLTIDMAARQGVSQARIQLSPESLGGIRIQLSQTADGLVARVVAEHSAAAQTLQQGGAELRRSLESAGVPLLRLDIESSGQGGGSAHDPGRAGGGARKHAELPTEGPDDASPASPVTAVQLSNGAVVNVLA